MEKVSELQAELSAQLKKTPNSHKAKKKLLLETLGVIALLAVKATKAPAKQTLNATVGTI